MASSIISRLNIAFHRIEQIIGCYFGNGFPPGALCAVNLSYLDCQNIPRSEPKPFLESLKDGFLFAVPTSRRSKEMRLKRRFGWKKYVWKPPVPKSNILICLNCGNFYMPPQICLNCYKKVKYETQQLQEEIKNELGLKPIEKEVMILYEGDVIDKSSSYWKNQQIVEIPRKRPDWFHSNLLQSTTEKGREYKDEVKVIEAKISDP